MFLSISARSLALAATLLSVPIPLQAQPLPDTIGSEPTVQFQEGVPVPTIDELVAAASALTGTDSPLIAEVRTADTILANLASEGAANNDTPYRLAQRFWDLHAGKYNTLVQPSLSLYAEEWPVRANPLIVRFFDATQIRVPEGDQTAWCAAFINWVLQARLTGTDIRYPPTLSAGSQSFRTWGEQTDNPVEGDIVVFKNTAPGEEWRGHVGFFVAFNEDRTKVLVLGGNQRPGDRTNTGEINRSWWLIDGRSQDLHSFRTSPDLH